MLKLAIVAAAVFAMAGQSDAQDIKDLGDRLTGCEAAAATLYGLATCDPPATLVGAVIGKCSAEEEAVRESARLEYDQEAAEIAIQAIRARMSPLIQSWLLDAQLRNPSCRPSN